MKNILTILLLLVSRIGHAQNLVPNGDFEQYYHCPTSVSQIDSAKFWYQATNGTADYYNQCGTGLANVPNSNSGFQLAHSGVAYTGIIIWSHQPNPVQDCYREYIEVVLNAPLVANECYHFQMYINLINYSRYTADDLGILISDTLIQYGNTSHLPLSPQIQNVTGNIPDTLNWTLVSGDYIAHGGEKYLTIGNFKNELATDTIVVNPSGSNGKIYIFIDDVSLFPCGVNGTSNNKTTNNAVVFPNPVFDKLGINIDNYKETEFTLYDIFSRIQFNTIFINSTLINIAHLSRGIYLYELKNKNGIIKIGRVLKD